MVVLKKTQIEETIVGLGNLSPETCKELLGDINEEGTCLVKMRKLPQDPNHAELEIVKYKGDPRKKQ